LDRDACELVLKKTFTPKLQPREEWDHIDQPYMYDFLPRDIRDLAIRAQAEMWTYRTDPTRKRKVCNAHPASDFMFSNKLVAKQDGNPLVGTISGDDIEYYRHRKDKEGRRKGSIFNKLIPAKALHEAVVKLLAEALLDDAELRPRLTEFVIEQRRTAAQDAPGVAELEAERDELKQLIQGTLRSLKGAALADAQEQLERWGDRRNEIEARLAQTRSVQQQDLRPVEQVVDEALAVLADDSRQLLMLSGEPLRDAVNQLVTSLTVDMETKAIELTVALPVWATAAKPKPRKRPKGSENEVCPPPIPWSSTGGWTHVPFVTARCEYFRVRGSHTVPPCYTCQRRAAA
jgi:hypothetical protein